MCAIYIPVRYKQLYYGTLIEHVDFHRTTWFRSYGIICLPRQPLALLCDPLVVFSATEVSEVVYFSLSATSVSICIIMPTLTQARQLATDVQNMMQSCACANVVSVMHFLPQSKIIVLQFSSFLQLNHFVRCNSVCYVLNQLVLRSPECVHPMHTNELLIRMVLYLIHYCESIVPRVVYFCAFIT